MLKEKIVKTINQHIKTILSNPALYTKYRALCSHHNVGINEHTRVLRKHITTRTSIEDLNTLTDIIIVVLLEDKQ